MYSICNHVKLRISYERIQLGSLENGPRLVVIIPETAPQIYAHSIFAIE